MIFTSALHGGLELALLGVSVTEFWFDSLLINYPIASLDHVSDHETSSHTSEACRGDTSAYLQLLLFVIVFFFSKSRHQCVTNLIDWLPNHMLVIHVLLLFSVLNPLVIPFGFLYFCVEGAVIKNQVSRKCLDGFVMLISELQLIHVYAKIYEQNGRVILVRLVRYSLDGKLSN